MDVVNESSAAPKLRRAPFVVRLAPEFLSRMAASIPANEHGSKDEVSGLLFGLAEAEFALVQVFRPFSSQPGRTDGSGMKASLQQSFHALVASCQSDPELAGLKLLGWFSASISGGLAEEGIAFHEENFSNINDLALIVRNEPTGYLSLELYCRSLDGSFSAGQNRWGVVRISTASPVSSPLEVLMRTKIHDDLYMRAYQFSDRDEDDEPVSGWKSVLAARAKKT